MRLLAAALLTLLAGPAVAAGAAVDLDDHLMVVASAGRVTSFDLLGGVITPLWEHREGEVTALKVIAGKRQAIVAHDGRLAVIPVDSPSALKEWEAEGPVVSIAPLADGRILTGGWDGRVSLWKGDGTLLSAAQIHRFGRVSVAAFSDGRRAVSGGDDQTARLLAFEPDLHEVGKLVDGRWGNREDRAMIRVAVAGGRVLAGHKATYGLLTGSLLAEWDPDALRRVRSVSSDHGNGGLDSLHVSGDGTRVAYYDNGQRAAVVWDVEKWRSIVTVPVSIGVDGRAVAALAPAGYLLAAARVLANDDLVVELFDAGDGHLLATLAGGGGCWTVTRVDGRSERGGRCGGASGTASWRSALLAGVAKR